jgi:membrane protein DedA with SNARE-associated domain
VSGHEIQHLVHVYGCAIVFAAAALQAVGAPVPGTTVLVAAAVYAAATHGLPIVGVIAAGAAGVLIGTSVGFGIGRLGGPGLLIWVGRRLRQSEARVQRLRGEFARHGAAWVFVGRFITGIRNVSGLVAGASGMPLMRFLLVSTLAAIVWATLNALEYYWFGRALSGASTWIQVLLVCAGLTWMVVSLNLLRRRTIRRLQAAPELESEGPAG